MSSLDMPVTLIVKAPNQQIEDQTIQCELNWTIKRLKGYLSEVYPSKPRTEEQKLIYSGHLLNDSCTLQEVLRNYEEGQDQHTVHLVCARNSMVPPRNPDSSGTSSSDGTRRRTVRSGTTRTSANSSSSNTNGNTSSNGAPSNNTTNTTANANSQSSSAGSSNQNNANPTNPQPASQAMPQFYHGSQIPPYVQFPQMPYVAPPWTQAQYAAWMHQAYAQYMAQYMHMMSQGSGNQFQWQFQHNVSVRPQLNGDQQGPAQGQPGNPERAAGAEEGDDEDNAGRDWLDWFYMASRIATVFAFMYFYTTPMRFLVVFCLGLLIYLYNIGFFRPLDDFVQVLDNNNDPARVDAAAAAANNGNNDNNNNHQPQGAQGEENAAAAPAPPGDGNEEAVQNNTDGAVPPAAAPQQPPAPDRPSLLALTWTFFTSFFASLIPEQPAVI